MPDQPPSWRPYDAPGDEPGDEPLPEPDGPTVGPFEPYGPPGGSAPQNQMPLQVLPVTVLRSTVRTGRAISLVVGLVTVVTCGGGAALMALVGGGVGLGIDGGPGSQAGGTDMHSQEALDELVADLHDELGTSRVFDATFYPDRAFADVHVPGGNGGRYDSYTWSGDGLEAWGPSGSDDGRRFDLADLDATRFDEFCARAQTLVAEPGDCYIIVDPDDPSGNGGLYSAYTTNEYGEGGFIRFDSEGDEVVRTTW